MPDLRPSPLRISRAEVDGKLAAVQERRRRRERHARQLNVGLRLALLGFLLVAAAGVHLQAPWYVEVVRPSLDGWLSRWRGQPAGTSALQLPSLPEPGSLAWLDEFDHDHDLSTSPSPVFLASRPSASSSPVVVPAVVPPATAGLPPLQTASRPRPSDYNLARLRDEVRAHVLGQPQPWRRLEAERAVQVANARPHLLHLMRYIPYESGPAGILLRNGERLHGTVIGANDNGLLFRPRGGAAGRLLAWEAIPFQQVVDLYDYYIAKRLQFEGLDSWQLSGQAGERVPIQARREAAAECLLVGILCDWYDQMPAARHYFARAATLDPQLEVGRFAGDLGRPDRRP